MSALHGKDLTLQKPRCQLAEQLETDDEDARSQALAELEAALLAEEGNKAALAAKAVAERFRAAVATC